MKTLPIYDQTKPNVKTIKEVLLLTDRLFTLLIFNNKTEQN